MQQELLIATEEPGESQFVPEYLIESPKSLIERLDPPR